MLKTEGGHDGERGLDDHSIRSMQPMRAGTFSPPLSPRIYLEITFSR